MSMELARARLRGIYAIIAGAIIIVVIPFFQGSILAGTGYVAAVNHIGQQPPDFGPYLAWVSANQDTDVIFHAVEFLAFLLIFTLPPVLSAVLWPAPSKVSLLCRIIGQVGFGSYALAVLLGLLVSGNSAGSYASASTSAERADVAAHFANLFALQNILAHIIGGVLAASALMILGAQLMRSSQKSLPGWLGYLAVLVAALLVITALQFAAEPSSAETSLSSLSFFALALWLITAGIYLARLTTVQSPPVIGGKAASGDTEMPRPE